MTGVLANIQTVHYAEGPMNSHAMARHDNTIKPRHKNRPDNSSYPRPLSLPTIKTIS